MTGSHHRENAGLPSDFTTNHFTRLEKKAGKSNRWFWKCKGCGDDPNSAGFRIEGRDNKLATHISDPRQCPHASSASRAEALRLMASKKPLVVAEGSTSDDMVIDVDAITSPEPSAASVPNKKRKANTQGTLNGYIDQAMTETQKNNADRKFLRYLIHANVSFRSAEDDYLADFLHDLRPSYDAPKRYVL
ncbi:hypothetical protein DFH06DRAFT_984298, partial [Mycena polygramma]